MRFIPLLIFSFSFLIESKGQTLEEIQTGYQALLDHPEFIKVVNKEKYYFCDGTFKFKSSSTDTLAVLYYTGKKLIPYADSTEKNCLVFSGKYIKGNQKGVLICSIKVPSNITGKCYTSKVINFSCKIKNGKNGLMVKKFEYYPISISGKLL